MKKLLALFVMAFCLVATPAYAAPVVYEQFHGNVTVFHSRPFTPVQSEVRIVTEYQCQTGVDYNVSLMNSRGGLLASFQHRCGLVRHTDTVLLNKSQSYTVQVGTFNTDSPMDVFIGSPGVA